MLLLSIYLPKTQLVPTLCWVLLGLEMQCRAQPADSCLVYVTFFMHPACTHPVQGQQWLHDTVGAWNASELYALKLFTFILKIKVKQQQQQNTV